MRLKLAPVVSVSASGPGILRAKLLITSVLGFLALAAFSHAQTSFTPTNSLREDFWDVDGNINSILATNGNVYLGGSFSYVAPKGRKVAAFDLYTGAMDSQFPSIQGTKINAIISDTEGGWFIGGKFLLAGGIPRTNLVHILADDSIDLAFEPHPNGEVMALALDGTNLFVGGAFDVIAGNVRHSIAKLDSTTGAVQSWAPEPNDDVFSILVDGNTVYVGGRFTSIGGQTRKKIAALDASTGFANAWDPSADGDVLAMALLTDRLFVGGSFNRVGGQLRNGLAQIRLDTGLATTWDAAPGGGKVTSLKLVCSTLYVGGYFTSLGGAPRNKAGAVNADTGLATAWNPQVDAYCPVPNPAFINAIEVNGDAIYLGGKFCTAGTQFRKDLAAVNSSSGLALPWNPSPNGQVTALAIAGRRVIAGFLHSPGGVDRQNLASLDALTGKATPWDVPVDGEVFTLAMSDSTLFVGGAFTNFGGFPLRYLAAVQSENGNVFSSWNPNPNNYVHALAPYGGKLFVGGRFTSIGGTNRLRLAALDINTGQADPAWIAHADGTVYSLVPDSGMLYLGGAFVTLSGVTRHRLAAVNATTGQLQFWNPDADDTVRTLALSGQTVYAGGVFNSIGVQPRAYIAAMDTLTGSPTLWKPGADSEVRSIVLSDNTVFVGGAFSTFGGAQRFGCAAVLASDGSLLDWAPGASIENQINALALSPFALHVGADSGAAFAQSIATRSLAVFPRPGSPVIVSAPQDQSVFDGERVEFRVSAAGAPVLYYQWSLNSVPILSGTNATTLILPFADPSQSGRYSVLVTNEYGGASAEAQLTVLAAPAIITSPGSVTVPTNGPTVVLSVSASGSPPPVYQWRRNGVNIPGAAFPNLSLESITALNGGSYSVVVANRLGAIESDIARVRVSAPDLHFSDSFSGRGTIFGATGLGDGNSPNATAEPGEPLHAGKVGGKSLWLNWIAPVSGVATFTTKGSDFDTLLAVYTGSTLSTLQPVASDEDRGSYLNSLVSFNAQAGQQYAIAVDGLAGASGHVILSWTLDAATAEFPKILAQPSSTTLARGQTAYFSVGVGSPTPVRYQWFFECLAIPGATNDTLAIPNIDTRNVGNYHVVVSNAAVYVAESAPATLEIGDYSTVRTFDKLEDLLAPASDGSGGASAPASRSALSASSLGTSPLLVSMGSIVSQTFNTADNTTSLRETNHCGVFGGHSAWLKFTNTQAGTFQVDTMGSTFDTVLAIYRETTLLVLVTNPSAAFVTCDDDGASDGIRSLLRFKANAPRTFLAVVDGAGGVSGAAKIRFRLGLPPTASTNPPATYRVLQGGELTLTSASGGGVPAPTFQWRVNGTNISGANGTSLTLANFTAAQAGSYSIVVSNFAGMVTNTIAQVTIDRPPQVGHCAWTSPGRFTFDITGNPGDTFVLETSSNLKDWLPIATNQLTSAPFLYTDSSPRDHPRRFFRAIRR